MHYAVSQERREGNIGITCHPYKALAQERNRIEQRKGKIVNRLAIWSDYPACQKWRMGEDYFAIRKYIISVTRKEDDQREKYKTTCITKAFTILSKGVNL